MALIEWNEILSVKVKEMDEQHKKLIEIINNLNDAMKIGKSKEVIGDILSNLAKYITVHFTSEEKYMEKYNYPELPQQKKAHETFVAKITDYQKMFKDGKTVLSIEIMNFLKDWLTTHIKGTDKKYGDFFNSKGLK